MTENRFFRGHKMRRGSFDLFSSYEHFVPNFGGTMALAGVFILGILLSNGITLGLQFMAGRDFVDKYGLLISYPLLFSPPLLFSSVMSRVRENSTAAVPVDKGGFGVKGWFLLGSASVFATIAAAYVIEPVNMLLPPMPDDLKAIFDNIMVNCPIWVSVISVAIYAPLFEELLCRGLILRGLLKSMHPALAITLSALFFAIIHVNPWQAIPAFALGTLFGYVYYRTGSLKLTMLMHFANNITALTLTNLPQFKDAETFMDVLSPWAYWCIFAACILIVVCSVTVFHFFPKTRKQKA